MGFLWKPFPLFLTFLFYIPKDSQNSDLGTVLYEPKDKDFNFKKSEKIH